MPRPSSFISGRFRLALVLSAALLSNTLAAAVPVASEYDVKAAFLFQFARFVEWPVDSFSSPNAPLTICVMGSNPFGSALQEISRGESVQTHALAVKIYERLEDLDACHIVFVSTPATATVLGYLAGKKILTVGDGVDFTTRGGAIGFVTVNGKVRLHINRASAESSQLRISAKLLRVAEQRG